MKKTIYKLVFLFLIGFIFSSCSKELTKEEASNILSGYFPEYCNTSFIRKTADFYGEERLTSKQAKENLALFKKLEEKGLLKIKEKKFEDGGIIYSYNISEKWKEKFGQTVKPTQRNFVEVLNITEENGKTIVEFKTEWKKTPFYELHYKTSRQSDGKFQCYETTWTNKVEFEKNDKGWKLKNDNLYNLE